MSPPHDGAAAAAVHDPRVPLAVYIDIKSPYAFIAMRPIRAMARALGVAIDWRPFTLDIPSYLGSARLDRDGRVAEANRTPQQWSGVRYAYRDARRYAALTGQTLRGTEKIWDSSLAGIAMLWAKQQSPAGLDALLDDSWPRFWRRELDIEDPAVLVRQLQAAGVDTTGFADYAAGPGRALHDTINRTAFDHGVFGVPTFVVAGEQLFGREHLPRVDWLLRGRPGACPDVCNRGFDGPPTPWPRLTPAALAASPALEVIVDIRHPHCALGLRATLDFIATTGLPARVLPLAASVPGAPTTAGAAADRGTRHRAWRSAAAARDTAVYAQAMGLTLAAPAADAADPVAAHAAILWADRRSDRAEVLRALFEGWWTRGLDAGDVDAVTACLRAAGLDGAAFATWFNAGGREARAATEAALRGEGIFQTPALRFGDELFYGRQHLPMIAWLAGGRTGPVPI